MVFAIVGRQLDDGLAPPFPDHVAAEHRYRADGGASRVAAHEYLCCGAVDGVSAICTDRTSDDDQLRSDGRVPGVQTLVSHESAVLFGWVDHRRESHQRRR